MPRPSDRRRGAERRQAPRRPPDASAPSATCRRDPANAGNSDEQAVGSATEPASSSIAERWTNRRPAPSKRQRAEHTRRSSMHDIDRVRLETQYESELLEAVPFEAEQFEFLESEAPTGETGELFGETEQMELASELLEVTNEAELDRFLGDLIQRAGQAVGKFIRSP